MLVMEISGGISSESQAYGKVREQYELLWPTQLQLICILS